MIYNMFDEHVYSKFLELFNKKSTYLNEKYEKVANLGYSITDAERFLNRVCRKYIGLNICIIDKVVTATKTAYKNYDGKVEAFINHLGKQISWYSTDSDEFQYISTDNLWIFPKKRYLSITNISACNKMHGGAYIVMTTKDIITGDVHCYRLDSRFFRHIQYTMVDEQMVLMLSTLLNDDREDIEFEVSRRMTFDEMVSAKLCRKNCAANKIPFNDPRAVVKTVIKAKDYNDAYAKSESDLNWPLPPLDIHRI